jgi:hypothetical protein
MDLNFIKHRLGVCGSESAVGSRALLHVDRNNPGVSSWLDDFSGLLDLNARMVISASHLAHSVLWI